jgi:GDP-mannose 4,6 dehydratase
LNPADRKIMNLLLTGGAGFIGSNLVRYLLAGAAGELDVEIKRVITLDKLTYAGNRASLADLESDPRHLLVQGDIGDSARVGALLREYEIRNRLGDAPRSGVACGSLHRQSGRVYPDKRRRDLLAARSLPTISAGNRALGWIL